VSTFHFSRGACEVAKVGRLLLLVSRGIIGSKRRGKKKETEEITAQEAREIIDQVKRKEMRQIGNLSNNNKMDGHFPFVIVARGLSVNISIITLGRLIYSTEADWSRGNAFNIGTKCNLNFKDV
jgi:2-oxo-4-hydroxy-4-carboxy--5-ureidoimidazoline (OHCU) decarboxylase